MKRVSQDKTIEQVYQEFQTHNRIKNLASHTIEYYQLALKHLSDYLHQIKIDKISQITKDTTENYILWLENRCSNAATINNYLRAAKAFIYYAIGQGYTQPFKISLIKEDKAIQIYTDDEIQKLIKKPDLRHCYFGEYRNWVLCIYLLETGNRLQSIINIKISDVHLEERYIILRKTKNRHQQIVPITQALLSVLPDYISTWGLKNDSYLFPSANGGQLSENAIKQAMAHYNKSRGVNQTGIHKFRHTFGALFIKNGGGAFQLQRLMGHSDIATTQKYVHFFGNDLQKEAEKYSIVGRMKSSHTHIKRHN